MATLQERLQIKRVPIDKWSVREQLCLASAVVRSGDQNWMSVSRALKPFAEPNRPPDWFSQKNCAAQYGSLLENVETPKRKKRMSGSETVVETPGESIVKKLTQERLQELNKRMEEQKREYLKLKAEMELIKSGAATDAQIEKMCAEIDEEDKQKEKDAIGYAQWLKIREERKLEVERVFRPHGKINIPVTGQKRKASESIDSPTIVESPNEDTSTPTPETPKPALSPLLTSLLKTPTHVPNVTSSILHSAITNHRGSSPTIASLLNTTTSVPVSPSLQQLVSSAIGQEPISSVPPLVTLSSPTKTTFSTPTIVVAPAEPKKEPKEPEESIPEIKVEIKEEPKETEETVEEPVVEEKEETVEEVKQPEIKEPEVITEKEIKIEVEKAATPEEVEPEEKEKDVYDFDTNSKTSSDENVVETVAEVLETEEIKEKAKPDEVENEVEKEVKTTGPEVNTTEVKKKDPEVEKKDPEVVEEEDSDKEMDKKVSDIKRDMIRDKAKDKETDTIYSQKETVEEKPVLDTSVYDDYDFDDVKKPEEKEEKPESQLPQSTVDIDTPEYSRKATFTPEYTEPFFDDLSIEVTKLDKSNKAKRDYSRTRKKEEKEIDILFAVEKVVNSGLDESEILEETSSEKDSQDSDKKSDSSKTKIKIETERSSSPWTEEEEVLSKTRRRLSATPATPSDSIPNSPASGIAIYEDDRDYRTWKKSVLLVYSRLAAHKYASLFLKPITDEQAPGYHSQVFKPMDLQTIRKNVENGHIRTTSEFQHDVLIMFNNAVMYNKSNETVFNMARQMQQEGLQQIQILLQAQTQIETPARRETRTSESGLKRKRGQEDLLRNKKRRDDL